MSRALPSLTALKVFEVAGRLRSFSKAAAEMNITQGAVSRQIRALEDELRVRLFVRLTRQVQLSPAGEKYLAEVQAAFRTLEQATAKVREQRTRSILTISVLPSVGSFWLMPRLARFSQRHPEIETRVISSIEPVNLHGGEVDVAIRVGALPGRRYDVDVPRVDLTMMVDWRGVLAEELAPDTLVPVFSPSLTDDPRAVSEPAVIQQLPLIHTTSRPHAWPDWMRACGLAPTNAPRTLEYGHFFMSMEAARQREGVAIVPDILLSGSASQGLVAATGCKVRSAGEYYLLSLNERCNERAISTFRDWAQQEMTKHAPGRAADGLPAPSS
ncbi:LysR substrate-binding domain-containing protein [Ramlibacter tataouinensis]|uniref:LysR substrate-binding domain-containing protein n=1 Tax=Ramlibacter tataouinensis TaxID=94132 RepID=UPI0022F390A0|nr:LysR substrate-binding domain-containing protein [Ramlibacter tataouinensis]WBY02388.1 LysR substrate-binding domain-containing protein [Ramlibacter tataouinensis]